VQITLVAAGSRGDVQPLVGLGTRLREHGLDVRIVALETFRPLVVRHGLEFAPLGGDPRRFVEETGIDRLKPGRSVVTFLRRHRLIVDALYRRLLGNVWAAMEDADAVAFGTLTIMAYPLADARGIPRLALPLQPITRSRHFPSITVPQAWSRLGGTFNLATHRFDELVHWLVVGGAIAAGVRQVIGSHPFPRLGPYTRIYRDARFPFVYGVGPTVFSRPPDWPPWHVLTGFWFLETDGALPASVEAFLADGPPPVYVGFGSLPTRDPTATAAELIDGVRLLGHRVVVSRGWGGLRPDRVPADVLVIDEVPHHLLFRRVAAVVHHGGAGTTAAALRAGRPQVVVPHFGDQPFWAERMFRLGVAPAPLPLRRLDGEGLAAALRRALDPETSRRAAAVGEAIEREDGAGRAADVIVRFLEGG